MRTETAQRVVVLGREGAARDQLVGALDDLGVAPVWVGRPGQNNPDALLSLNPNKIVISLEPAIELELEPYIEILGQPGISVVYDDAESSKGLDGWDLNRWARHFAAKLLGHSSLPPLPGKPSDAAAEQVAAPVGSLPDFGHIPVADDFAAPAEPEAAPAWQDNSHYEELEIDQGELQRALEQLDRSLSDGYSADAGSALDFELAPLSDEENSLLTDLDVGPDVAPAVIEASIFDLPPEPAMPAGGGSEALQDTVSDEELRAFLMQNAATVVHDAPTPDAARKVLPDARYELALAPEDMSFEAVEQAKPVAAPEFDLSRYALVDETPAEDAAGNAVDAAHKAEPRVRDGGKSGLFLVISGVGGPGALRSLLDQIPADFQGIVALSHQIDPTQIPAFRTQLQKVSKLPLEAIEDNEYLKTGHIYLLPPDCTLFKTPLGYQCLRGGLAKFIDQIDHDAEILVLSGADAALSQALIQVSVVSRNIHVQNPDDCYESGLVRQLVNAGAPVLERDIIDQWFN